MRARMKRGTPLVAAARKTWFVPRTSVAAGIGAHAASVRLVLLSKV